MNKYRLAELCKLKPNDYSAGLADSILKNISSFEQVTNQQFQSTELSLSPTTSPLQSPKQQQIESNNNNINNNNPHPSKEPQQHTNNNDHDHDNNDDHNTSQSPQAHPVKSEPLSPPPLRLSQPKDTKEDQRNTNPMSLGKVLWSNGHGSQSPATRSHPDDDNSANNNNKRQRTERKVLPKPAHTVSSQHSFPNALNTLANKHGQTLLAKRQGKNSRHLTIFAPSYADQLSVAIRSAPLNSNFRNGQPLPSGVPGTSTIPSQQNQSYSQQQQQHLQHHQQQHHHQHGQNNSNQPSTATTTTTTSNGMTITTGGSTSLHPSFHHSSLRQPPKTATTLQPGHTLAPLLSPRAAPVLSSQHHGNPSHSLHHHSSSHHHHLHHSQSSGHHHHLHHPEPKTTGGAIGKQEFAIPPIVPSQQQPPHTAHPHNASASNFGRPHSTSHGYPSKTTSRLDPLPQSNNNSSSNNNNSNSSSNGNGTNGNGNNNNNNVNTNNSLPLTASAAPMPPQTPTTFSFAALQRQQFLQPFEQLFDTIETTRTLKTTLDDQIRRSSTLLQTLQASSTTVEALIRSQIKEVQKDVMNRMDDLMEGMMKRIIQLESRLEIETSNSNGSNQHQQLHNNNNNNRKPTSPPPTSSSLPETNGNGTSTNLKSPPTIVRSQNDIGSSEYQSVLNTLRERLDKLEKSIG
ncbi:unnamed protein product [Cunninghamella echinulata]